jgi:hypothetical protein
LGCSKFFDKDEETGEVLADGAGLSDIDWVVIGGESGPNARPFDVVWSREIVRQCRAAGVPVFVKQIGAKPYSSEGGWSSTGSITVPVGSEWRFVKFKDKKGGDMSEWPPDIQIREFPDHTLPIGRVSACEAAA